MRQSHRLIWNSLVIWGMRIVRLAPELLLLPFVINRLGREGYGVYVLAWSMLPVLTHFQSGVSSALVKYSAEHFAREEYGAVNKILNTSCAMSTLLGLVGGTIFVLVGVGAPHLFTFTSVVQANSVAFAFVALGASVILAFPLLPFSGILHALQRYDLFSAVRTATISIRVLAIVVWFVWSGPSVESLVVISAVVYVAGQLVLTAIAFRLVPQLRLGRRMVRRATAARLLGFSIVVFGGAMCLVANQSGMKWMMGAMVSLDFVTMLVIVRVPASVMMEIVQAMSLSIMPAASKYHARNALTTLRELFVRGTRYMFGVVLAGVISVVLMTEPVLEIWMGPEYKFLTPYVLSLCVASGLLMSASAGFHMLRGMGRLRESFQASVIGPVLITFPLVAACFLLGTGPYWAVAIGVGSGHMIQAAMQIWYCSRSLSVRKDDLWSAYGETMLAAAPALLLAVVVESSGYLPALHWRISLTVLALSAYGLICWFGILNRGEKKLVWDGINAVRSRLPSSKRRVD